MLRTALIFICVILLIGGLIRAQQTETGTQTASRQVKEQDARAEAASIEKLIFQLGSKNFKEREEAKNALETIGPSALGPLRKAASENWDLEVRRRAEDLVTSIERRYQPEADFAWFDTLGFPDLSKCKYVRVATGDWFRYGKEPPQNSYVRAFLVSRHNDQFTIFGMNLRTQTFKKTTPGTPEHLRVGYEILDWKKETDNFMGQKTIEDASRLIECSSCLDEPSKVFILARACSAAGNKEAAGLILQYVHKIHDAKNAGESLRQHISDEFAFSLMWDFVLAFEDLAVSRKELLIKIENIVQNYPERKPIKQAKENPFGYELGLHGRAAREYARILKRMVQEDEVHERKVAKAQKDMANQQRVAELIFQLREQNGHQFMQPGWCDIFSDARGEKSPAHQLVAMGYDAVPQLIDALEDDRLTRSVGFHRNFYFSHHVLRVGDCAEKILERIAGRSFWNGKTTNSAMLKDGEVLETKKKIEAWWQEVQNKGEKQVLIDGVAAGDWNSTRQADRLVSKYPKAAFDAISKGIANAQEESVKGILIRYVGKIDDIRVTPFLKRQLSANEMSVRIDAADQLMNLNHDDGLQAMVHEWKELRSDADGDARQLSVFLAGCGRLEAIQTLSADLRKRPAKHRFGAVERLSDNDDFPIRPRRAPSKAVEHAVDDLLVQELSDTEQFWGESAQWGDKSFNNPRLCDIAGHILSRRWNQPDLFDLNGSLRKRDRQRLALQNVWRSKQGMPALSLPTEKKVEPLSETVTRPVLTKVMDARTAQDRKAALKDVESLGIRALPALQKLLAGMTADSPARREMQTLATRLAFVVTEVTITEHSVKPQQELQQKLDAQMGISIQGEPIVDLLVSLLRSPPQGVTGVELHIEREGDGSGTRLVLTLVPDRSRPRGNCHASEKVFVGEEEVYYHGHSSSSLLGGKADHWNEFATHFKAALEAPPEKTVLICASSAHCD